MIRRSPARLGQRAVSAASALALLASLIPLAVVSAAVTVAPATGGSAISSDQATNGTWTTLTGPVITEGAAGELGAGTFTLALPSGFVFNPAVGTAVVGRAGCAGMATSAIAYGGGNTTATVTLTGPSTAPCSLTFSDLQVRPAAGTPLASGTITASGTANEPAGSYGTLAQVPGAAILTFAPGPPASTTAGSPFAPPVTVHSVDQFGNLRVNDPITITIQPGTGTAGAAISNCAANPVPTDAGGDADFTGCRVDTAGANYQLRATNGSAVAVSTFFNVTAAAPASLLFQAHPSGTTSAVLSPQPSVSVVDAFGNVVTTDTRDITLSISANSGTFSCAGGRTKAAVAGVAQFAGCTQSTIANGYTLTASDGPGGLANVTGPAFNVTSGLASKLAICWNATLPCSTAPPSSVNGGATGSIVVTVRVQDSAGNQISNDNTTTVALAIAPSTPTSGGPGTLSCTGGNSKVVANGVAQFTCSIDRAGNNYRLVATSTPALTPATSGTFNVVVGPAVKLGFLAQPTTANARATFTPNIVVAVQDAGGNTVTTGTSAAITLVIANNSNNAVLTCTGGNPVAAVNGVATFTGCSIDRAGTYTLTATPGGVAPPGNIAPATSAPIVISAQPAQITLTASSVITWGESVVFTIQFAANGANRSFTMQASPDAATWTTIITPALRTDSGGRATFAYRPARNYYYRIVFAAANDLGAATSNIQRVVVRQIALLRPTNGSDVDDVSLGTTRRFTTTVRPARPELPRATVTFVVYRLFGRTWTLSATRDVVIDARGLAAVDVTFSSRGKWYVRSIARPTTTNANSVWSPVERYDVR
jgi:hypothetical protein